MLGQVVGFGVGKAGNYLGGKFGRSGVPDLAADLPSSGKQAGNLDVSLQAKRLPKLDMDSVHLSSRKDLHLKASTADADLGKLRSHSTTSLDVPKVKGTLDPSPSPTTTRVIIDQKLQEYGVSWDEFNQLRNTHVTKMTQSEYDMMIDIRNAIPYPNASTKMQKILL